MEDIKKITTLCLLAGKIMMKSGAETYRVEDTMSRMAAAFGMTDSECFVTPTGIIFSLNGEEPTKLIRLKERATDLRKVTIVNDISRKISSREMTADTALQKLKELEQTNLAYPVWLQLAAASVASGCFLIMFYGRWSDFLPAVITGLLGFAGFLYAHRIVAIKFFAEFLASLIVGFFASLLVSTGIGAELDKIIISSIMPLVPGLLITNAIRDLMAGQLVSGLSKGADSFLTAFAIGTGIAVALTVFP
ncbi:threonine/serine exporter family protein [Bacillaceae bacterium Marseille-Q3522]|nr:threonine/serine exporter family protein [Bacillaceae bacterium Marseille-Q3522]